MDRKLLDQVLEAQLAALGTQGLNLINDKLNTLVAGEPDGWKKNIYTVVNDAVSAFGPIGINKALNALHDMIEGKPADISWADLEVASDLLAHMENLEADSRSATRVFITQLGGILADIGTGILMSL